MIDNHLNHSQHIIILNLGIILMVVIINQRGILIDKD